MASEGVGFPNWLDTSFSDDDSAASDTTDANQDQLASVMELFHDDDNEFDSSFDGFQAETDDNENEDEQNNTVH